MLLRHAVPGLWLYDYRSSMRYDTEDKFRREAEKVFEKRRKTVHFDRIVRIRKHGDRSGHAAAVELTAFGRKRGTGQNCIIAGLDFLSAGKQNWATDERFDTSVLLRDCSGERGL